jgi:xylulose-5-phosphate/fructose-6-phosphate phosphoketolase
MEDHRFDAMFTLDKPVIFAFHGYPTLVHKLTYNRRNHDNFHVHGYREEGTTTTPFDMVVLNGLDRFTLALDAIERVPRFAAEVQKARDRYHATLEKHVLYVSEHGEDMPEVANWQWTPA